MNEWRKVREIKQMIEDLVKKHKQFYNFTTRGNLKTNSRRGKEGRTKSRTRKMKGFQLISTRFFPALLLHTKVVNKVQLFKLRQGKWVKAILKNKKLPKNVKSEFLQNLIAVVQKTIAKDLNKSEDDSRGSTDEESTDNESGDGEGSYEGTGDKESSDKDVEEQEMMTIEQVEFIEQYQRWRWFIKWKKKKTTNKQKNKTILLDTCNSAM